MKVSSRIFYPLLLLILLFSACSSFESRRHPASVVINAPPAKRILFCGDSITWGGLGSSYLNLLAEQFPDYELVNLGLDGDTVSGIMNRTISHLRDAEDYDLIVISAGHNDILLPAFSKQDLAYRLIVRAKNKQGSIPAKNYSEFITTYDTFINSVLKINPAPIVLVTLSCLSEDMNASTNKQRLFYNQGIRTIAAERQTGLADVGKIFDNLLQNYECRDYIMNDLIESVLLDRHRSETAEGADKLSRARLLHLTIDGAHLNPKGAEIYSKIISQFLDKL